MSEKELENLKGSVEDITFSNAENGFTVLELDADGELVTVVGTMTGVQVGEEVEFSGEWTVHPSFGRQFKAYTVKQTMPSDASGILRYLSSGVVSGVRESTAVKIVEAFGAESLDVMEKDPERLATIKGISLQKAKKISKEFKRQFALREIMVGLTSLGLTPNESFKAYNLYKNEAYDIISRNPFAFCNDNGFSFDRACEISESMKKQPAFALKSEAGVTHIVRYNLGNGHTCIPRSKIIKPATSLLDCSEDDVEIALDNAIFDKTLISEDIDGKEFLFLPEIYRNEKLIADRIKVMLRFPPQHIDILASEITAFEEMNDIEFDGKQKSAIEIAVNKGLLILTGGPGTGKTTTVKGILSIMQSRGLKVALTAPTGRAAKRMSELTGCEAKTIHRLLEVEFDENDGSSNFVHDIKNPLDMDAVIVDELSMVDVTLFAALLDALPLGCRLIMVGDKDQLPPVGAGNVLFDLTKSGLIDVVVLDKVFRQAMKSLIVTNAHRVVKGEMPVTDKKTLESDFFLMNENSRYNAPRKIVDLVTRRLPQTYQFNPMEDIQVLCPSRMGEVGTVSLNQLLQKVLNPADKNKKELRSKGYILRDGDKVMQIKNNYDVPWFKTGENGTGVFNGDIGILTRIDTENNIINVMYDDREAMYSIENANELELAYAMTVHKSQGSEFDCVIMPIISVPEKLAYRNLFYTAITRAKKLLVLVGTEGAVKKMVDNDKKSRRYSALVHFLSVDNNQDMN